MLEFCRLCSNPRFTRKFLNWRCCGNDSIPPYEFRKQTKGFHLYSNCIVCSETPGLLGIAKGMHLSPPVYCPPQKSPGRPRRGIVIVHRVLQSVEFVVQTRDSAVYRAADTTRVLSIRFWTREGWERSGPLVENVVELFLNPKARAQNLPNFRAVQKPK